MDFSEGKYAQMYGKDNAKVLVLYNHMAEILGHKLKPHPRLKHTWLCAKCGHEEGGLLSVHRDETVWYSISHICGVEGPGVGKERLKRLYDAIYDILFEG